MTFLLDTNVASETRSPALAGRALQPLGRRRLEQASSSRRTLEPLCRVLAWTSEDRFIPTFC
jgi:hypothetical protein